MKLNNNIAACFVFRKEKGEIIFATSDMKYLKEHVFSRNGSFESSEIYEGGRLWINDREIEVIKIIGGLNASGDFQDYMQGKEYDFNYALTIFFR